MEQYVKVFNKYYTKSDIEKMPIDEITKVLNDIPAAIFSCKNYIKKNKLKGPQAEKILFAKAQLQSSMNWISAIRKQKRIQQAASFNELFTKAAYKVLDSKTVDAIYKKMDEIKEGRR